LCRSCEVEVIDPGPFLWGLSTSALPTADSGCSLWPTASARDWKSSASNKHGDNTRPLNEVVALEEKLLWPTAQAHDAQGAKTPEQIEAMRARAKPRKGGGPPGISGSR
jgi:hypothetical protein